MNVKSKQTKNTNSKTSDPLARLLVDNKRMAVQLANAKASLRETEAQLEKTRADLEWIQVPTHRWPLGLTYEQKLHDLGRILAALFYDENLEPPIAAAFQRAMEEIEEQVIRLGGVNLPSVKAHHWFPKLAMSLTSFSKNKDQMKMTREIPLSPPSQTDSKTALRKVA